MARFAYGASDATAPLGVFGAGGLGNTVVVGAAALVVVITIVLVFLMVLRSNGASKRTASGLGYDAQQGPIGQPRPEDGASPWQRQPMPQGDMAGAGMMGQMGAPSAGRASSGVGGWGQTQDYGAPAQGGPAPAAQGGWNNAGPAAGWDAPAPQSQQSNPLGGTNPWGIGGNAAAQADPWGQRSGWDAAPSGAPSRPAANAGQASQPAAAGGWDVPAGQGAQGGVAGAFGAWGAPAGQPAPAANAGAAAWGAPDAGVSAPAWGAPSQPAPAQATGGGWGSSAPNAAGAAMGQPQPASGANWGQDFGAQQWGAPAQATPAPGAMPQSAPQGYGEVDKTRVVRPAAGAQGLGMLVVRQGKEPGRIFEIRKDRLTIGRSRESDIFLEDLAVSRLHTTVSRDEYGRYIMRDENSANGTYVNGQRVSEHVLEEGDEIQVGQSVLAFVRR